MSRFAKGKRCPFCRSRKYKRTRREEWMRSFPGIKKYKCRKCGSSFIGFFQIVSILLGEGGDLEYQYYRKTTLKSKMESKVD